MSKTSEANSKQNEQMSKFLGIDYGTKRIGYAVSDEGKTMAFARGVFEQKPGADFLGFIENLIKEERITKIVLGLPLDMENKDNPLSVKIRKLGAKLAREFKVTVDFVDEFNTSDEALSKIPLKKHRRTKGIKDAISAQVILQRYLMEPLKNI